MLAFFTLLAQGQEQPGAGGGLLSLLITFLPIFILAWFMFIRPAQKQERERRLMLSNLKENDRVIAAGGILGTVIRVKENKEALTMEDEVTLKVADNVKIRVLRSAIHRILTDEEAGARKDEKEPASS